MPIGEEHPSIVIPGKLRSIFGAAEQLVPRERVLVYEHEVLSE
jgi:hypothetical protein